MRPTILARSSSSDGKRRERLDAVRVEHGLAHRSAEDHELLVRLGEVGGDLGRANRIARIGDHGRSLQQGTDAGNVRAFKSDLGEAVLGDLHRCASLPGLLAQDLHLGNREAGIVSHDDGVGGLEDLLQLRHLLGFCRSFHKLSPVGGSRRSGTPSRRLHVPSRSDATCGGRDDASCPASGADMLRSRSNGSNRHRSDCSDHNRPHPSVQAVD